MLRLVGTNKTYETKREREDMARIEADFDRKIALLDEIGLEAFERLLHDIEDSADAPKGARDR